MKAVRIASFGRPDQVVECIDVAEPPAPQRDELLLEVLAFPIDPADEKFIEDRYSVRPPLPSGVGSECVARVVATGDGVLEPAIGDLVIPLDRENWTQRQVTKADRVVKVPAGADLAQLSMLKISPATAFLMMTRYVELKQGDWILQNAANSTVGRCLVQLAKVEGFRTINIVRRQDRVSELETIGADLVLVDGPDLADRISAASGGGVIKLAVDAVAGDYPARFGDALADGATILTYSDLSRENVQLTSKQCVFKRLGLTGFGLMWWHATLPPHELRDLYWRLGGHVREGRLHVPVAATLPIERIKDAVRLAREAGGKGKVLVTPNGPLS